MKTNEEITKWLLENAVNKDGDLSLRGIDLSKFDGNVYITDWKVKKDLSLNDCEVGGDLSQNSQIVKGNLYQDNQVVKGELWQDSQKVEGAIYSHKLEKLERWEDYPDYVRRIKLKPITKDKLAEMGYILVEEDEDEK